MSINEGEIDLDLALGSPSYIPTSSNNSSGAGVNAKSRVDMGFAVSDPLSELVWSPHNGLRLKCADSGMDDKNSSPVWNLRPSTKCLTTSLSVNPIGNGELRVGENKQTLCQNILKTENRSVDMNASVSSPQKSHSSMSGAQQFKGAQVFLFIFYIYPMHLNNNCMLIYAFFYFFCLSFSVAKKSFEPYQAVSNHEVMDVGPINVIRNEEFTKDGEDDDVCSPQHVKIAQTGASSKENAGQYGLADESRECKVGIGGHFLSNRTDINAGGSDKMCLNTTTLSVLCPVNGQPSLEPDNEAISTPEEVGKNQMASPLCHLHNVELSGENDSGQFCGENDLSHMTAKLIHGTSELKHPSRICLRTDKGKQRASSEGDAYGRSSNDENDSNGSVESCTSARLFEKGFKRESCDQEVIVGNKRMKKDGCYGSMSIFGHDSSFMNWISNMVKGLSDTDKQDPSSLTLAVAGPSNVKLKDCQENFTHSEDSHDSAKLPKGFHTIFQSMYSRSTKKFETTVDDREGISEDMKELTVAEEMCSKNLPQSVERPINDYCKQIVLSDIVGQPNATLVPSYACESDMPEYRNQGATSSSFTSLKQCMDCTADDNPWTRSNMPEKSNHLASLWITRFYTGTSKLEISDQITLESRGTSAEYLKENTGLRIGKAFPSRQRCVLGHSVSQDHIHVREEVIQELAPKAKASLNLNFSTKPNSPVTKRLLASAFARHLDALKNITPSDGRKFSTCGLNCFFCGRVGHDLSDCPEITETELDDLLMKLCSLDRVEEFRCLCIRCLQLGHWAVSCPLVSSSMHWQPEENSDCINSSTAQFLQLFAGKGKKLSSVGEKKDYVTAAGASQPVCNSRMPHFGSLLSFATWNMKEPGTDGNSRLIDIQKRNASNSENELKMCQSLPLCSVVNVQNKVPPAEVFHAIRKLRLSRSDVLKWMSSNLSLQHLNGLFLRLRLGKMEAGLGDTGYYVARVTVVAKEYTGRRSNKSIVVDVGGMKSSVGSQYISNQDFSEDEIDAWWHRVLKSGGNIPSLDELNLKFKDKTSLGL